MNEMTECSSCGTELHPHEMRCPTCGKPTAYYHRQRRCLNCGTPVAERAKTCLMCGQPADSLPLNTSIFSGSWVGIGLGLLIIVLIVLSIARYQWGLNETAAAVQPASPTSTDTPTPTITPTPGPTDTPTPTATATPTATPTPRTHIVESGETLSYIAALYEVTVDDLIALNNIEDVSSLRVKQELLLPPEVEIEQPGQSYLESPLQIVYVIESGDTLLDIALKYGTSVEAILALNPDIDLDLIYSGQSIVVPLATPTSTSTPTVTPTSTPTPGPLYPPPNLLMPAEGEVVDDSLLLFNWTATGLLAEDDFYVLQLVWADGSYTEYWVKQTSWRIEKEERPAAGPISWRVAVMQQTKVKPDGSPSGVILTEPVEQRTVVWP